MTITQLERESGVGRNTIYYYISEGLLPPAQKASATRAVYNRLHSELLEEIGRLKAEGLALREIREELAARIEAARENGVDLVAQRNEATHDAILQAAARRFAEQGYEKARITDICRDVGVNAQLLYSHFPSKKHLFIACFDVYFSWMHSQVASPIEKATDSAERLTWRVWAGLGIQALSRDLQAMARVEALHPESDLRSLVREVYEKILEGSAEELAASRGSAVLPSGMDDELISYGFLGVLENMEMRASWDEKYTNEDIIRNLLFMFLAVRAAFAGRVDLGGDWDAISGLVKRLAAQVPRPEPPAKDPGSAGSTTSPAP